RRHDDPTRLFALIGASDGASTRFWMIRIEGTTVTQTGGPYTIDPTLLGDWGEVLAAQATPTLRLRPRPDTVYDPARPALASFVVADVALGDVTDALVEVP